jgi:hypothetical protein
MSITPVAIIEHCRKHGLPVPANVHAKAETPKPSVEIPKDGYDSQLERDYAVHLDMLQRAGIVKRWDHHCMKLSIGAGAWYTVDFVVVMDDGRLEGHETKGFMREAAAVRIKAAAKQYPWNGFKIIRKEAGVWQAKKVQP